jgi:hypothetical protein
VSFATSNAQLWRGVHEQIHPSDILALGFSAPMKVNLTKLLKYPDFKTTPEENRDVAHSVSTVVIGSNNTLAQFDPISDWKLKSVLNEFKKSVGEKA